MVLEYCIQTKKWKGSRVEGSCVIGSATLDKFSLWVRTRPPQTWFVISQAYRPIVATEGCIGVHLCILGAKVHPLGLLEPFLHTKIHLLPVVSPPTTELGQFWPLSSAILFFSKQRMRIHKNGEKVP